MFLQFFFLCLCKINKKNTIYKIVSLMHVFHFCPDTTCIIIFHLKNSAAEVVNIQKKYKPFIISHPLCWSLLRLWLRLCTIRKKTCTEIFPASCIMAWYVLAVFTFYRQYLYVPMDNNRNSILDWNKLLLPSIFEFYMYYTK